LIGFFVIGYESIITLLVESNPQDKVRFNQAPAVIRRHPGIHESEPDPKSSLGTQRPGFSAAHPVKWSISYRSLPIPRPACLATPWHHST